MAISTKNSWTADEIVSLATYSINRVNYSWEEDFGHELINIMVVVEREFDPESYLTELEVLLYVKPTVKVQQTIHHDFERVKIEAPDGMAMPRKYSTTNRVCQTIIRIPA